MEKPVHAVGQLLKKSAAQDAAPIIALRVKSSHVYKQQKLPDTASVWNFLARQLGTKY